MDIVGKLPRTKRGNVYLLVIVDRLLKLVRTIHLRVTNSLELAKALTDHWVFTFGFSGLTTTATTATGPGVSIEVAIPDHTDVGTSCAPAALGRSGVLQTRKNIAAGKYLPRPSRLNNAHMGRKMLTTHWGRYKILGDDFEYLETMQILRSVRICR